MQNSGRDRARAGSPDTQYKPPSLPGGLAYDCLAFGSWLEHRKPLPRSTRMDSSGGMKNPPVLSQMMIPPSLIAFLGVMGRDPTRKSVELFPRVLRLIFSYWNRDINERPTDASKVQCPWDWSIASKTTPTKHSKADLLWIPGWYSVADPGLLPSHFSSISSVCSSTPPRCFFISSSPCAWLLINTVARWTKVVGKGLSWVTSKQLCTCSALVGWCFRRRQRLQYHIVSPKRHDQLEQYLLM